MIRAAVFRSGNTLRVTIPRVVREALKLEARHQVLFVQRRPGEYVIANLDALAEEYTTSRRP